MLSMVEHSPSEVVLSGPAELAAWREQHSMIVPGAAYMPLVRRGKWDGVWRPGRWLRQLNETTWELRGSRGLAMRISRDLGWVEFPQVAILTDVAQFIASKPNTKGLRPYQLRALSTALLTGWGRVAHATNAGKGAVIALLAMYARELGHSVTVLCDELAVYDALEGELQRWGSQQPEYLKAGLREPPSGGLTLGMVPTLAKRLEAEAETPETPWHDWLAIQTMLLLDEADKANSPRWRDVLAVAKNTVWRIGFSGTFPAATDIYEDLRMDDLMGPVLDRVTNEEMVEAGVSARPSVELHAFDATSAILPLPSSRDWWGMRGPERRLYVYERTIVHNAERHQFVASLVQPDTPTAIVVNRIDHGEELTAAIPGAVFLDGSASESQRLRVLDRFREGTVRVLVVTKILDRGTNRLGHAADLIFASGEGSPRQTLQRIGRGLRRAGGKEFLRLVDVVDRIATNGTKDRRLETAASFLHGAARRRVSVYSSEGFLANVVSSA